jgi:hypothetical protein
MKSLRILGVGSVLLAASAFAFQGTILKFAFKKGDISKLKIVGSLQMMGADVNVTIVQQQKVLEVAEDGTATLESSTLSGTAVFGGQEMEIPAGNPIVLVMESNGKTKEIRGEDVSASSYRVEALQSFLLPKEPVKVGSKWVREEKANADTGAVALKAEYEILAEETIGKYETFKIRYKNSETEGAEPASMEGTIWISKADAQLIRGESTWVNVPMAAAPAPVSGKFTLTRED